MGLFSKEFIIESSKSRNQIEEILRDKTDENTSAFKFTYEAGKEFFGSVHSVGFELKQNKGYQRRYNPTASGIIIENDNGSTVITIIETSGWVVFSMIGMLIGFGYAIYMILTRGIGLNYNQSIYVIPLYILPITFSYLIHVYKVNSIKNKIIEIISTIDK